MVNLPIGTKPEHLANNRLSENGRTLFTNRYCQENETIEEAVWRVASNVATAGGGSFVEKFQNAEDYYNFIISKNFMPNSPTFFGAGTLIGQLSACYVVPIEDSMEGILKALRDATLITKYGGGVGFSFSNLRGKNAFINTTKGVSSGVVGWLRAYNALFREVQQGGARRGAFMAILNVDHPDILEFIDSKTIEGDINMFNLSVGISDNFINAVKNNKNWELICPHTKEVVNTVSAREIFDKIVSGSHRNGEPAMVFMDTINYYNANDHVYKIEATNPCAEQPLEAYNSCNLGSINLNNFVEDGRLNQDELGKAVRKGIRFLNNVLDTNKYVPEVPELKETALKTRRIGLGVMGYWSMLVNLGIEYGSDECLRFTEDLANYIQYIAVYESSRLARINKKPYPLYEGSKWYSNSGLSHMLRYPQPKNEFRFLGLESLSYEEMNEIKNSVIQNGVLNTAMLTVAPTGTISTIIGETGGIEPEFALVYTRFWLDGDERKQMLIINPLFRERVEREIVDNETRESIYNRVGLTGSCQSIPELSEECKRLFKVSNDIKPIDHIRVQAVWQKYIDSAISKTINCPNNTTKEEIGDMYLLAHNLGLKGVTFYRNGSREVVVLATLETIQGQEPTCPVCSSLMKNIEGCETCMNPECSYALCSA